MSCCFKKVENEELEIITQQAKEKAIRYEVAQAIYKEGDEYFFTEASTAIAGGYPIINILSPYQ